MLAMKAYNIGELVEQFDMSFNGVSKHAKILEKAGFINREIQGTTHVCHLNAAALNEAYSWLGGYEQFWRSRLVDLKSIFENGK
jgi:DNA-binding transcriptional ArsR family regulator